MQKEVTVTDGPRLLQDRRATATGAARLLYECNNGAGLRAKDELRAASGPSFGGGLGRDVDSHCLQWHRWRWGTRHGRL
jgi:hypothetical protein